MTIETSDWEKINDLFNRASERMDRMVMTLIPRAEYDARHLPLVQRIDEVERRVTALQEFERQEHKELMGGIDKKFDALIKRIDEVDSDMKDIKEQHATSQETTLRYIVSVIVSFLVGGGGFAFIQFLMSIKH